MSPFLVRVARSLHISQHFGIDTAGMHEFMIYQKSICNKTRLRHNIKILDSKYKHLCNHPPRTSISNEHMLFFFNPPSGGAMLFLFFSPASQVILDAEQRSRESSLTPGSLQWFLPRHLQAIHLGGPTQHVAFCCFFVSTSSFKQKTHSEEASQRNF